MVDFGGELALGRFEGVVWREGDGKREDSALVRTICWAHNRGRPVVDIAGVGGASRAVGRRVSAHFVQLLLDSLERHILVYAPTLAALDYLEELAIIAARMRTH